MTPRIITIIESPYAGNVELHTAYARLCLFDSLQRNEAPFASHLLYPQVLLDHEPDERAIGLECNRIFHQRAGRIAFYSDFGMSPGMLLARQWAHEDGSEVVHRRLDFPVIQNLLAQHGLGLGAAMRLRRLWHPPGPIPDDVAPHKTDEK